MMTTLEAAHYARSITGVSDLTLVIGTVKGDGAVCEGFPFEQIVAAINKVQPSRVVLVGEPGMAGGDTRTVAGCPVIAVCATLEDARQSALENTPKGSVVLAVKTWR
jgi:coenzyme F430 synthetase